MLESAYAHLSAAEIAHAVRTGSLSAYEVTQAALERIDRLNPCYNAFTAIRAEESLAEARALDSSPLATTGVLAGVPVAAKEEFDVVGLPTTIGGYGNSTPAKEDCPPIARLREAGAIIVGKTTMPEFGQFPDTASSRYGVTLNPWNTAHSPGGSSGGSAVAIAAGMVPVALGADGGGSIRLPASCCGLVGLKPELGQFTPDAPSWFELISQGAIARTATDSALVYSVISGETEGSPNSYAAAAQSDPGTLRIVWSERPVVGPRTCDHEVRAALNGFVGRLRALGHSVAHTSQRWPIPTDSFLARFAAGMHEEAASMEHPDLLEPRTRTTARVGGYVPSALVKVAMRRREAITRAVDSRFLSQTDVLVLPTMPLLPGPAGWSAGKGTARALLESANIIANTAIFNVTGHPAISVPGGVSASNLPIGIQLVARHGQEKLLLALAAQFERRYPWPTLPSFA